MRVHVLQHVAFEGLGSIEAWLAGKSAIVSYTRFYESSVLPHLDEVDFIIVLGGPMSVNDEELFSWLAEEKRFISKAISNNKGILGICLGCQLIASALGSKVYPGKEKEIGWFPVYSQQTSHDTPIFPDSFEAFHWHGETFDLPPEADFLASSAAYRNQAFQIGRRILGLQFHLEATPESVAAMISNCSRELSPQHYIQTEKHLLGAKAEKYEASNSLMDRVLEYLFAYPNGHDNPYR